MNLFTLTFEALGRNKKLSTSLTKIQFPMFWLNSQISLDTIGSIWA